MHINSIEAYESIVDSLNNKQKAVLTTIKKCGRVTRQGVAQVLDWEINRVTGRVKELIEKELIKEDGSVRVQTGRSRAILVPVKVEENV